MSSQKELVKEVLKKVDKKSTDKKVTKKPIIEKIENKVNPPVVNKKLIPKVTNVINKEIKPTVTIKFRGVEAKVDRKTFINVQESPDGLIFNFANGMHLVYTNQHLHNSFKIMITTASAAFLNAPNKGSLIIDLDDLRKPVKAIFN